MEKLNISIIITVATVLLSVGGSWGVINSKIQDVDKVKEKTQAIDTRLVRAETKLDSIQEDIQEQKVAVKEVKDDTKQILKLLMESR